MKRDLNLHNGNRNLLYVGTVLDIRNRAMTKTPKNPDPQWGYKVSITRKLRKRYRWVLARLWLKGCDQECCKGKGNRSSK